MESRYHKRFLRLLERLGFKLPREHGLTAIWAASVLLGIGLSLGGEVKIEGLLLSLTFSLLVIFGSDSIMETMKRKFSNIIWLPSLTIILSGLLIFLWKPVLEILFIFSILGLLTGGWLIYAIHSRHLSLYELIFGSVALAMLAPFIYIVSTVNVPIETFFKAFSLCWINIGVTILLIVYVESLRGKVPTYSSLLIWCLFLTSFIPLILLQLLHPISLIAIIEPTFLSIFQTWKKELLKISKKPIKKVGIQLLLRLFVFVSLILITIPIAYS